MKNAKYLGALALLLVACSGGKTTGGTGASTAEEKKAAAEAANGSSSSGSDVCAEKAWYGDGVCDSFCADHDADCVPDGTQVVCAEFIEESNGVCERADDDPCKFQDPDCGDSVPPSAGGGDGSGGGVVCAMFVGVSDGVCSLPKDDPCSFQDPDCAPDGGGTGGSSSSGGSSSTGGGTGTGGSAPVVCPAIAEQPNGKCELPASDPCRSIDPDCNVACAEYIEQSDGVCSRDPNDPCIFQDPDCNAK